MAPRYISRHREDRALHMRRQGLKPQVIGERLGVNPKRVHIMVANALQRERATEAEKPRLA